MKTKIRFGICKSSVPTQARNVDTQDHPKRQTETTIMPNYISLYSCFLAVVVQKKNKSNKEMKIKNQIAGVFLIPLIPIMVIDISPPPFSSSCDPISISFSVVGSKVVGFLIEGVLHLFSKWFFIGP